MPTSVEPHFLHHVIAALRQGLRALWLRRRGVAVLLAVTVLVMAVRAELETSWGQARLFSTLTRGANFSLASGRSLAIRFPDHGAYNERLGYARLPDFLDRLERAGYVVDRQARSSPRLLSLIDRGVYPPYVEKMQAGVQILDRTGREIFTVRSPERIYRAFDEIPPLVVQTVLFLENQELLTGDAPFHNPAIEWDRTLRALLHLGMRQVAPTVPRLGGSTLATQLEKIRHSPQARTGSVGEKLRQMTSASLRAYLHGTHTLETRRRIVTAYLNALPLAALPGHGEVTGLGDGLWAWYGADIDLVNRRLGALPAHSEDLETARAYRQLVSLLIAIRRPSDYLVRDPDSLTRHTDDVLNALGAAGIVNARLARLAQASRLALRRAVEPPPVSFVDRKPATAIRGSLASTLGLGTVYDLDRTDVTVLTTLDQAVQQAVTAELGRLADPAYAASVGITGPGLLGTADPAAVVYSLVVLERGPEGNVVRVQADNLDQPLDVNAATKLELGSTAKLRTLVTYLELVSTLHAQYAGHSAAELASAAATAEDPLTGWTVERLRQAPQTTLPEILEAALERRYSASPHERFVTGGGVHVFSNFDADDNHRAMSVRLAFRQSVNLVFIRLMRDIVRYHVVRLRGWEEPLIADPGHPGRLPLLQRFADREGIVFLDRFLDRYRGLAPDRAVDALVAGGSQRVHRLAVIHRSVHPFEQVEGLAGFLARHLGTATPAHAVAQLYQEYNAERWSLADRGYLAGVHPLELWLLADLVSHPDASRRERMSRATVARQEAYAWLFRTHRTTGQNRRIRVELERDAFVEIHRRWRRIGYPFDRLVPSYATAIGSSGDNPAALAELMGIIQNGGARHQTRRVTALRFAEGTPSETWLRRDAGAPEPVMDPTVAQVIRQELVGVVEHGTGRRIAGALTRDDGTQLAIGGKTGTGDNRVKFRGSGTDRVLNRTATFTFVLGERFYGTLTAYVDGSQAADYRFTSALPVQVLKQLAPTLRPLFEPALLHGS